MLKTIETDKDTVTTVFLDHAQRLNLVILIGNLEANVNEMRALWRLQDLLSLTSEEQETIGMFTRVINGNEVQGWDVNKSLPLKSYDLNDADIARLRRALEQFPRHKVALARPWLEPLLGQLPELLDDNKR